jgi:hypothetical protein
MNSTDIRNQAERLRSQLPTRGSPPPENGKRLAAIARSDTEELRVHWSAYQGKPFVSIRLWKKDHQSQWWPDKRGVSIRIRELPDVAVAVAAAMELAEQAVSDDRIARAGGERRIWRPENPSALGTADEGDTFDEFDEQSE